MTSLTTWNLLAHLATTLSMVGLIWFVQIVHYPLMAQVGSNDFSRFETEHQRLTTWVVAPLMLGEFATAILLLWHRPQGCSQTLVWLGLALLAIIWLATYTVQVPQHTALAASFNAEVHRSLVNGNWIRTLAWSARGGLVLWIVGQAISYSSQNSAAHGLVESLP